MQQGYDILDALSAIDPASLDYAGWLEVGQALHHEGYGAEVWREWSRRDAARFDERDFDSKWKGFGNAGNPVTGGTIVKMARDAGWKPRTGFMAMELSDTVAAGGSARPIADGTVAAGDVLEPYDAKMTPEQQAAAYLEALFEPDERVGYVCQAEYDEHRGKWKPAGRGTYARSCADIVKALRKGTLESALGTYEREAGIWCCFNPLDGEGRNNTNVASLRYVLVESDETEPAVCKAVYEQLNLPVAAMVFSGAKSLHAVVRVDAADLKEYAERREAVYRACEDNGLKVDRSNKNPARLSRLPGARRGGKVQFLVSLACGAGDFDEWQEWYEAANDDLPDCETLSDVLGGNMPELAPELICGVLRERHKMLVSGPSKAGKSFVLMELCVALAEGREWLGFRCRASKVLYVNLELDAASCWHRFADVYRALGIKPAGAGNVDVWNLRGLAQPMGKLLPKMVRRGREAGYEVIVIDPIYKIMTGDENSAADMAAFANAFDRLALEVGCSVIYCHHHSKGWQDGKRSIDRASGSGVFGRDPDAILDLIELDPDETCAARHANARLRSHVDAYMADLGLGVVWQSAAEDVRGQGEPVVARAKEVLQEFKPGLVTGFAESCDELRKTRPTAWRCEGTLREFAGFDPVNLWFDYPLHVIDDDLKDAPERGAEQGRGKQQAGETRKKKSRRDKVNEALAEAVEACADDGVRATRRNVLDRWPQGSGIKKPTIENVRDWTKPSRNDWCEWVIDESSCEDGGSGTLVRKSTAGDGEQW